MRSPNETPGTLLSRSAPEVLWRIPPLLLPMIGFLLVAGFVVFSRDRVRDRHLARQRSADTTQLFSSLIDRELESITATLLHFADQEFLRDFLMDASRRASVEDEYVRLCRVNKTLDQIRVIRLDGKEILRVNHNEGNPSAVPEGELQSKGSRYYFQLTQPLAKDEVYVSAFDLNVEQGRIEEPWKPVLRLATPVFDGPGAKRGILVLNYLGQSLFDRLSGVASQAPGWTWLVDHEGHYLEGPDAERSWGFMFGREPSFAADHPRAWAAMRDRPEGSLTTDQGLFTFRTIAPTEVLSAATKHFPSGLKVVSFIPMDEVYALSWSTFRRLGIGTVFVAIVLFAVAWRLAFVGAVSERHEREIAASERRLRVLSRRLLDVQESERKSFARNLHDEVGQLATSITIDLKRARKISDPGAKDELIAHSLEGSERLLTSMHEIVSRIRSSVLDDMGLESALRSCGEDFERTSGVPVELRLQFEDGDLPPRVSENVYRIVQEALTNVQRHARAGRVSIGVCRRGSSLCISVSDSGVGFDPAEVDPERLGILGMRERAELLGGTFRIESSPVRGTTVTAEIPLAADDLTEPAS